MCGIHGCNFEDKGLIKKMMHCSRHRGPDDSGFYVGGGISMGHNRLSIIDLSKKGHQPMWSQNKRYAIVFNGEIYNFKKLRTRLENVGHKFISKTDTEVILAGYDEWGKDVLNQLDGIFAFAIWDNKKHELFLARDHIGIKPLYYYYNDGKFIFSSEIKSILAGSVPRKLNKEAFNLYLAASYVPGPLTLFKDIYKLLPAHYMMVRDGKMEVAQYWEAEREPRLVSSRKEVMQTVREKVISSVYDQLVSDRPLGVYLSGGIDSSVVLASMKQARSNIDTFSVGFDVDAHEEPEKFNADFNLAHRTAKYFGTNHHEVLVSSDNVVDSLEDVVWHMDEPISNATAIAMYTLSGFTKGMADVVLGGEGGDELFAGYTYYKLNKAADYFQKLPKPIRSVLSRSDSRFRKLNTSAGVQRYALFMMRNKDEVEGYAESFNYGKALSFFNGHFFTEEHISTADELMYAHRKSWLVDYALVLTDKMSMSSAVEVRVPLLAKDVVEYAVRIPDAYKVSLTDTKIILKNAFKNDLPQYLFNQPKRGWVSPAAKWLRHERMYSLAKEVLSPNYYSETSSLFDWAVLKEMLESHKNGGYHRVPLWAMIIFQMWAKRFNITL